jgi:pyruvate kinase
MKKTKIVATIGPASFDVGVIGNLIKAGVNVARFNFSHERHENASKVFKEIRDAKLPIAIMLDTKGPEIRTGEVEGQISVDIGDKITFTIEQNVMKTINDKLSVNYDNFITDAKVGTILSIDSGAFFVKINDIKDKDAFGEVIKGSGKITTKRHINFSTGENTTQPTLGEKDWKDIDFAIQEKCEFIALSFCRTAKDVKELREYCAGRGYFPSIIAKIENKTGVDNLEEIVKMSDGIMVARGDLSDETPYYKVPAVQRKIIELCKKHAKFSIVATQMIYSMCENIRPTRAEVSDIANAVFQGADCTMTSDETGKGKYPIESIEAMSDIVSYNEPNPTFFGENELTNKEVSLMVAKGAVGALENVDGIGGIVVISKTGETVRHIASLHSPYPIFAFVDNEFLANKLRVIFGVVPSVLEFNSDYEKTLEKSLEIVKEKDSNIRKVLVISYYMANGKEYPLITVKEI